MAGVLALALALAVVSAVIAQCAAAAEPTGATGAATAEPSADPSTAAKKKRASAPANGLPRMFMGIGEAYRYHGRAYVLPKARVTINGETAADLDGQSLTIRIKKRGRTVDTRTVKFDRRGGKSVFKISFRTGKKGKYLVETELPDALKAVVNPASDKSITVVNSNIHRGSKSVAVRVIQHKLAKLKFVTPRGGRFDAGTGRALLAFRKTNRMARIESAGYKVARKLAEDKGGFRLRYPKAGRHIEVSISRQVMALADKGRVVRTYHVSTGAPGTPTVRGTYRVYRKSPGTNAKGMVHSSYFIRGYAIHGFKSVPTYNASHGCVRVPIPNAMSIFRWVRMGTRVDTYG